jgi:hypothetical protein
MQFRNAWLYDGAVDRFAEVLKLPVAVLACRSCDDARQLPGSRKYSRYESSATLSRFL